MLQYLLQISRMIHSRLVSCQQKSLPGPCWMAVHTPFLACSIPLMHIVTHPLHGQLVRQQCQGAMPEVFFHSATASWKSILPSIKPILGLALAKAKLIFIHFVHNRMFCVRMMIQDELISTIHLEKKRIKTSLPFKIRSLLPPCNSYFSELGYWPWQVSFILWSRMLNKAFQESLF